MAGTPDLRPVKDLPNEVGKMAAREPSLHGIASLESVVRHSRDEMLAIQSVGPRRPDARGRWLRGAPARRAAGEHRVTPQ